jgi:glutamate formiminotransferase
MSSPIVACVPNFSEGREERVVTAILAAMRVDGVHLLDWTMDAELNRSLVTIAGEPTAVLDAAIRGAGKAAELIDLTRQDRAHQEGEHPRIGAADVIPFVPMSGIRLEQCVLLARQAGQEIWKRYGVPCYFYEAAATRPDRQSLEDLRRDQFEGLREAVRSESSRRPDIGGPYLHPSAGASAIGARNFLVTHIVHFNSADIGAARAIAREIRANAAGSKSVKVLALMAHGWAQLSLNISDYQNRPISKIYSTVVQLAKKHRIEIAGGEILGLIPEGACERESEWMRHLSGFEPSAKILERRLESPLEWPRT